MSECKHLKAILFDFDGTLVDSLPGIEFSVDYAIAELKMPARSLELRPLIGPPIGKIFARVIPEATETELSALVGHFRNSYDSIGWRKTKLHDCAGETLRALKRCGLDLFVVTNKPQTPTKRILENFDLLDLFTAVVCRDSRVPPFDSKAEMILEVVHARQLDPVRCLYVGDTAEDLHAAAEAAVSPALVCHGYGELNVEALGTSCRFLKKLTDLTNLIPAMELS